MKTATKLKPKAMPRPGENTTTDGAVLAQLAAMQRLSVNELKAKWEALLGTPAPNNARAFLELRIGYRIQELTYGGLTRETRRVLDLLADEVEGKIVRKGMAVLAADIDQDLHRVETRPQGLGQGINRGLLKEERKVF